MHDNDYKIAPPHLSLYRIIRDWMSERGTYPVYLDGYSFKHRYGLSHWGDKHQSYAEASLGWIDAEQQTVELITGIIRVADPEFFNKLEHALHRAAEFCCMMYARKRREMDINLYDPTVPANYFLTAQDVLDHLGEPKLL